MTCAQDTLSLSQCHVRHRKCAVKHEKIWRVRVFCSHIWCLPIRQEILNASQKATTLHRIRPPFIVQTGLPYHRRCPFFLSAHCSVGNPICFRSVWCRRTMIPRKIFTGFAKFQGIVSVNDYKLPIWLQELLQTPLCFLRFFLFCTDTTGSIGWPSLARRLHVDDRSAIHFLHWELRDPL